MPQPAIFKTSTVIITYRRDDALSQTLSRLAEVLPGDARDHEVVLVDNNADGRNRSVMLDAFRHARYVASSCNLGVAAGRNLGVAEASGEVLVFIDDDALVCGGTGFHDAVVKAFEDDASLGAVAFRSHMREEGVSDPIEFPHTDKTLPREAAFETFRFIGVGHAIRADAMASVGPYYASFFYGMEEFELCFRLMDLGWSIRYEPRFAVLHMKMPSGRLPTKAVAQRMYANKLCLAWMHLPTKEFVLCACAWAVKTLLDTRSPATVLRAILAFTKNARTDRMKRLPKAHVVNKISVLGGVPWR
jgi:GT2 family glycosyltransferase